MKRSTKPEQVTVLRFNGCDSVWLFGSISAIFDIFHEEDLGVNLAQLYALKVTKEEAKFSNDICSIKKYPVYRKKQTR